MWCLSACGFQCPLEYFDQQSAVSEPLDAICDWMFVGLFLLCWTVLSKCICQYCPGPDFTKWIYYTNTAGVAGNSKKILPDVTRVKTSKALLPSASPRAIMLVRSSPSGYSDVAEGIIFSIVSYPMQYSFYYMASLLFRWFSDLPSVHVLLLRSMFNTRAVGFGDCLTSSRYCCPLPVPFRLIIWWCY